MSRGITIGMIGRAMALLLSEAGRPILLEDEANGRILVVPPDSAAAADGLLPVFLVAGEAVWREVMGEGFGLEIECDAEALLGYRVIQIGAIKFSVVLLALMEATSQAARPEGIRVNALAGVWEGATERAEAREKAKAAAARGEA